MPVNLSNNLVLTSGVTQNGDYTRRITRDGLELYLDSINVNSYPGSGTSWYDLSGNGNTGTLTNMNSPSGGNKSGYDTDTGYMMFDRHLGSADGDVNNFVLVNNSDSLDNCLCQNGMTMEIWFKETSYYCTAFTKWNASWEFFYCTALKFRTQGTGAADLDSGASSSPGDWRQIVGTHDGTIARMYINGIKIYSGINIVMGQNTTNPLSIGAYFNGTYASYGAIPIYRLYNRALNPYEISENFQANRGRFSL